MAQTSSNSGTFDGLDATLQLTLPDVADDDFLADIQVSQNGIEPTINLGFAIDRSGSSGNDTGIDFNGDGDTDTFLEAQIFAAQTKIQTLLDAGYEPGSINVTIVDYAGSANTFTGNLGTDSDDLLAYLNSLSSNGTTNYAAALSSVEAAWDTQGVGADETNILYFYSDGFPVPAGQDFQTPLASLEGAYDPQITAVGFGPNTNESSLDIIDSSNDATVVTTEQELLDLLNQPPPLPDITSFSITVDGVLLETIPIDDPRVVANATGFTINDLNVTGYSTDPATNPEADVVVTVNFDNGDTLSTDGSIPILDGIVDGTADDDLIDLDYDGDPEGDVVDGQDNVDPTAVGDERDADVIFGYGGNDTIEAGAGDDTADGGIGDDVIFGESGDDILSGGEGDDLLVAGTGDDTMDGGVGDDTIVASILGGEDLGQGGDDADTFFGFGPGDTVEGGEGGDDNDTLDLTGSIDFRIEYDPTDPTFDPTTGISESGEVVFFTDGTKTTETGRLTFSEIEDVIPCFTPGALIATPTGEKPVEALREGDKVITRDNGIQEIRWIGQRTMTRDELARAPQMRPILIKAGSLGDNLPERDMLVSPQHRLLVSGERTQLYFDEAEVLVAAKHLVNGVGIQKLETLRATYVHFMFDCHEVVMSNGAWTESFQPGDLSLGSMGREPRDEIVALFPELASTEGRGSYAAARRSLKAHEARLLQL